MFTFTNRAVGLIAYMYKLTPVSLVSQLPAKHNQAFFLIDLVYLAYSVFLVIFSNCHLIPFLTCDRSYIWYTLLFNNNSTYLVTKDIPYSWLHILCTQDYDTSINLTLAHQLFLFKATHTIVSDSTTESFEILSSPESKVFMHK